MEGKMFYIVPDTRTYYEAIEADTKEDAFADFVDSMDEDMSAYFKVVDKEPVSYPHGYIEPRGKFELAMSVITATMSGDIESAFYDKEALEGTDLSELAAVAKLQEAYDMIRNAFNACDAGRKFYKVLKYMTEFSFDSGKPDPNEWVRVIVKGNVDEIQQHLNNYNVTYTIDAAQNNDGKLIHIRQRYLRTALNMFSEKGIVFHLLRSSEERKEPGKKLIISDIDWDYDGKDEGEPCPKHLPSEVVITDKDLLAKLLVDVDGYAEEISDYLSETYEYCVAGFSTDVEEVDEQ